MSDLDDTDELRRWARIMNKSHGYGGIFNYETASDKGVVELNTTKEWCQAIASDFCLTVGEPELNSDDPPDCYVVVNGYRLGVELIQLVEAEHKKRASKEETPYAEQLFEDMQWSRERLRTKLNELIRNKGEKYKKRDIHIDVLLVHTAELWLSSAQAREWLTDVEFTPHPTIANAFLIFEYEPGRGVQHWPLIHLYGNLVGVR